MGTDSSPALRGTELRLTEPELVDWGERFGASCELPGVVSGAGTDDRRPLVVAIEGELGAGKTTLAKAICRGFGVVEDVTSPTFALVHRYDSPRGPVYHLDLYRLDGPVDLTNLGWDDVMAESALVLVEWPERAGARLPPAVHLRLSHVPGADELRSLQRWST